jgi:alkyl sulfatase BDS1-like metallo-beta-lactamase superfamily hydrolase
MQPSVDAAVAEMRELFSCGDYTAALAMANEILYAEANHSLARSFRADCSAAL